MRKLLFLSLLLPCFWTSTVSFAEPELPTLTVKRHPVDVGFPAESVVEAVQQTTVAAQVAGRVIEVRADAGQAVSRGQVLMRIDAREAGEALRAAEAQYQNARLNYERQQQLKTQKFVSQAAVDKSKADFDAATANRSAASAGQSHATIVAPISGLIARRHAELGDLATPGKPLLTLYAPGQLRVNASIPQHRLKRMQSIKTAQVEFPELGLWLKANALQILPTVDPTTHSAQVRIPLPETPDVTPGMFARVHFITGQADKLTVPSAAIVRRGEVAAVYVLTADKRLSLRQLRLGEAVGQGETEILAGLAEGDQVVTDPIKAGIQLRTGH